MRAREADRGSMNDMNETGPGKQDVLVATAELERRKRESIRRLDMLEEEGRALGEVRGVLDREELMIRENSGRLREERERHIGRVGVLARRSAMIQSEIEELRREIAMLERRFAEAREKDDVISEELKRLEKSATSARAEFDAANEVLESGRATLSRIDHKLSLRKLKG